MSTLTSSFSLQYWLSYIESLHREEIDLSLERIKAVALEADLLHFDCPIVLVAGTNGKGSTVSTLATLLSANGLKVGAYFSPHLFHFNERIVVNGQRIQDYQLCNLFSRIEQHRSKLQISLTVFEFITLAALQFFKESACDIMVLEVGLGGRLDAVNIVDPSLSIVTTVALDHMDRLGDSIEKISVEKAGILRKDKPALIGQQCHPALLKEAARIGAVVIQEGQEPDKFGWNTEVEAVWDYQGHSIRVPKCNIPKTSLSLALAAVKLLSQQFPQFKKCQLNNLDVLLKQASLPGRFQSYFSKVETIFDVAHNPFGAQWLSEKLTDKLKNQEKNQEKCQRNIAIWSSFKDKDLEGIVKAIKHHVGLWIIAPLDSSRAATLDALKQALDSQGVPQEIVLAESTVVAAYKKAYSLAKSEDKIIVFGSCATVSEVMRSQAAPLVENIK